MSFRWVMGITLWTLLSGPIFSGPRQATPARSAAVAPAHRAAPGAAKSVLIPARPPAEKN